MYQAGRSRLCTDGRAGVRRRGGSTMKVLRLLARAQAEARAFRSRSPESGGAQLIVGTRSRVQPDHRVIAPPVRLSDDECGGTLADVPVDQGISLRSEYPFPASARRLVRERLTRRPRLSAADPAGPDPQGPRARHHRPGLALGRWQIHRACPPSGPTFLQSTGNPRPAPPGQASGPACSLNGTGKRRSIAGFTERAGHSARRIVLKTKQAALRSVGA